MKYLIGVYTNQVKSYCDRQFFDRINGLNCDYVVVDNSRLLNYIDKLGRMGIQNSIWTDIPEQPKHTQFLRNVAISANIIRDYFLQRDYDILFIIESDVIVPRNIFELFKEAIKKAENWGAIGGIYYRGFHDFRKAGKDLLEKTHHVLSGCTIYTREIIEMFKFRYDAKANIGAFPDAWMSVDIGKTGKNMYNYYKIVCRHLRNNYGRKGHEEL